MSANVTVINYGVGNLFSIANAFNHLGANISIVSEPEGIKSADRLVLPGVGAFRKGMEELRGRGLVDAIRIYAECGRPFLGICLGMQMMLDRSEEFGENEGLGLIPGSVRAIEPTDVDGEPHKIPHIAWSPLEKAGGNAWNGTILDSVAEGTTAYFVHSYTPVPDGEQYRLADTHYNGRRLSAAISRGHLYGTQFHPEKSGEQGLEMLRAFLAL